MLRRQNQDGRNIPSKAIYRAAKKALIFISPCAYKTAEHRSRTFKLFQPSSSLTVFNDRHLQNHFPLPLIKQHVDQRTTPHTSPSAQPFSANILSAVTSKTTSMANFPTILQCFRAWALLASIAWVLVLLTFAPSVYAAPVLPPGTLVNISVTPSSTAISRPPAATETAVIPVAATKGNDSIASNQLLVDTVVAPAPLVAAPKPEPTVMAVDLTNGNDSIASFSGPVVKV
ncbi:uncharacterized protein EV422DRAFT_130852 [Fimicolochytrium jonesii]|uniref:uncharacterized protein n=1 Tax=Fimicolochytrium jonesii TaxID=1396493 RepID=UPI0022FDDB4C|nr:uncharacterized protein EV422DRAFT_130852 [Fimicolochytrium jonesii]KAI8819043.1 hypothetical protein EV422DRAFT_130852 [Fimicolochytrium jonesii]